MSPLLVCRQVGYAYAGGDAALSDIDLAVEAGEWLLVAGDNGSGKSTLCRLFNGLIPHLHGGRLTGEVLVAGTDTRRAAPHELSRLVGWLGPRPDIFCFNRPVASELSWAMRCQGVERGQIERRVAQAAERFSLGDLLGRDPATLSAGQLLLVAIAAVAVAEPPVLVLDEPTAALDADATALLLAVLGELRAAGATLIVADHHVHAFAAHASRMLVLEGGRISADGDPARICADRRYAWTGHERPPDPPPARRTTRPALAWNGVSYARNRRLVIDEAALAIAPGELVCLSGANGAGKTTLLQLGCGLLRPQRGEVRLAGRPTVPMPLAEIARQVGYAGQQPAALLGAATVRAELLVGPRALGRLDQAWIDQLIAAFELEPLLGRVPQRLSSGQSRRVALAAIAASRPEILLLDEPTSGLDWPGKAQLRQLISQVQQSGMALAIATHDRDWAALLPARQVALAAGRCLAAQPAEITEPEAVDAV